MCVCLIVYLMLWLLTWVRHRYPLVELIVVRHSVKLTAQHLSKRRLILLTGFCVTRPITLPFPRAVLAPELWSVEKQVFHYEHGQEIVLMCFLESALTWGCYIPSLLTELQFHRSWSSETTYSTVPSLHSPSLGVYPQSHTLLRYTTEGEKLVRSLKYHQ